MTFNDDFVALEEDEALFDLPVDSFRPKKRYNLSKIAISNSRNNLHKTTKKRKLGILIRVTPWKDLAEFEYVYQLLFRDFNVNPNNNSPLFLSQQNDTAFHYGCSIIAMWRLRMKRIPVCVDCSQQLLSALYLMHMYNDIEYQRRLLAMAIVRMVNRLTDPMYNRSAVNWSKSLSFPIELIPLRHNIVHESMPTLETLKQHAIYALRWLKEFYWEYQILKMKRIRIRFKAKCFQFLKRSESKHKHINAIVYHYYDRNHLSFVKYLLPHLIDECLCAIPSMKAIQIIIERNRKHTHNRMDHSCSDSSDSDDNQTNSKKKKKKKKKKRRFKRKKFYFANQHDRIAIDNKFVVSDIFVDLYQKWQPLIEKLIESNPYLIVHLLTYMIQKREQLLTELQSNANGSHHNGIEIRIQSALITLWCNSWLEDKHAFQAALFTVNEKKFIYESILRSLMLFNDNWTLDFVQVIVQLLGNKQNKKNVNSVRQYNQPLLRSNVKSDERIENLIAMRLKMEARTKQLMNTEIESKNQKQTDRNGDNCHTLNSKNKKTPTVCKWKRTTAFKLVPIGHSVLPDL